MFLIIDDVLSGQSVHFVGASKNNVKGFKQPMGLPQTVKNRKPYIQCMFIYQTVIGINLTYPLSIKHIKIEKFQGFADKKDYNTSKVLKLALPERMTKPLRGSRF